MTIRQAGHDGGIALAILALMFAIVFIVQLLATGVIALGRLALG